MTLVSKLWAFLRTPTELAEHEIRLKALEDKLGISYFRGTHNKPHYRKKREYVRKGLQVRES